MHINSYTKMINAKQHEQMCIEGYMYITSIGHHNSCHIYMNESGLIFTHENHKSLVYASYICCPLDTKKEYYNSDMALLTTNAPMNMGAREAGMFSLTPFKWQKERSTSQASTIYIRIHNADGPAYYDYINNNFIYILNGVSVSRHDFLQHLYHRGDLSQEIRGKAFAYLMNAPLEPIQVKNDKLYIYSFKDETYYEL